MNRPDSPNELVLRALMALYAALCCAVFCSNCSRGRTHDLAAGRTGTASYYHDRYNGRKTANGEVFDNSVFSAASWEFYKRDVLVTNTDTLRTCWVRVNDRGPAQRLVAQGRILDLSRAAFRALDPEGTYTEAGTMPVLVEDLGPISPLSSRE